MRPLPEKRPSWALTGAKGRDKNVITSLYLGADGLEALNDKLQAKLLQIQMSEVRYDELEMDDAEIGIVAFGTAARVAQTAVSHLRQQGVPVGLFRPVTLWPFPEKALTKRLDQLKACLVVEMNAGQMVHDVRRLAGRQLPVRFLGRTGGNIPMPDAIETAVEELYN
jgi:2-oxoglutarate/2-oxoacid ferredoxin oxidoreductase subunit alpha